MKILLPPSEGKTPPRSGDPVDVAGLAFPQLTDARRQMLDALVETSTREDAPTLLGVGKSLHEEIGANTRLASAPTGPARSVYTGVLFAAMGAEDLAQVPAARRSAVHVMSGLFGIVGLDDHIPAYRLPMGAQLPELGRAKTWWKSRLAPVLDEAFADELLIDCRSADYRAAWPGPSAQTVTIDVVQVRDGARKVVSHFAKHTRGELVGRLLRSTAALPSTAEAIAEAAAGWYEVELTPAAGRKPASLTVVLPES
ncbi:MAG: YaaA family protein [Brevibacterium yomogidense]|uniref:YaaA family protein n=1 Tax=Brevibacterium sp. Mu109 TaxID=1255669 RepID=UPI000C5E2642|nr:peroxide stress protein YaaA [Brevibacterium sp. Mu109]SMX69091.1 hypothetical protein BSP109_00631 [Brevibacterium sp. Mu109]